jgi:hypothetical protein
VGNTLRLKVVMRARARHWVTSKCRVRKGQEMGRPSSSGHRVSRSRKAQVSWLFSVSDNPTLVEKNAGILFYLS